MFFLQKRPARAVLPVLLAAALLCGCGGTAASSAAESAQAAAAAEANPTDGMPEDVAAQYSDAMTALESGDYGYAAEALLLMDAQAYPAVQQALDDLFALAADNARDAANAGETYQLQYWFSYLETYGYADYEALVSEITAAQHITLAQDFYAGWSCDAPESLSADSTKQDFAAALAHMNLAGVSAETYLLTGSLTQSQWDHSLGYAVEDGAALAQSVFEQDWLCSIRSEWEGTAYTLSLYGADDGELTAELRDLDDFCRENLTQLNDNLILLNSMTAQQKTFILSDWICGYFSYDADTDAAAFVKDIAARKGNCQCYSLVFRRCCSLLGIPALSVSGHSECGINDDVALNHVWNAYFDEDGRLLYEDATWADGVFGGTAGEIPEEFWEQSADMTDEEFSEKLEAYVNGTAGADVTDVSGDGSGEAYAAALRENVAGASFEYESLLRGEASVSSCGPFDYCPPDVLGHDTAYSGAEALWETHSLTEVTGQEYLDFYNSLQAQ